MNLIWVCLRESKQLFSELTTFGEAAIPHLVEMLACPDIEVAQIAAAALRDVKNIDPRFLPQIIQGLDRNLDWLPPALGRINSPEAAKEAVARYLVSESAPYNQEAYAVTQQVTCRVNTSAATFADSC